MSEGARSNFVRGSYLWHLATGDTRFANRTLPWVKPT